MSITNNVGPSANYPIPTGSNLAGDLPGIQSADGTSDTRGLTDAERTAAAKQLLGVANRDIDQSEVPPPKSAAGITQIPWVGLGEEDVQGDMYAVMALFQKMAQEQRNAAREVRGAEMEAQVSSLKSAAQEIRSAAQDRFVGAVVSGAMQIVGGAMSIGAGVAGGLASLKGGAKTIESGQKTEMAGELRMMGDSNGADVMTGTAKILDGQATRYAAGGQMLNAIGQGSSGIAGGIGTIVNAHQEKDAAQHDAKKAELEADAKVHDSGVQQANDLMQQMMDVIRDVRDKLSSIDQSRIETNRGIARNI
jgi:hypothetical protein